MKKLTVLMLFLSHAAFASMGVDCRNLNTSGVVEDSVLGQVNDCLAGAGQYETDSNGEVIIKNN